MSWVRIWIHLVFSTKYNAKLLPSKDLRCKVFEHIKKNANDKGIWLDRCNGYHQHVHCLISLGKKQEISKIAQLIKGESAHWINKNNLIPQKFIWQDDYWAVSVSESHIPAVRKYIDNQEQHHKEITFSEEIEEFMEKYGWRIISGDKRKK